MPLILETPRLSLRHFTKEDAPLIRLLNSDPQVLKYIHEPALETEEAANTILVNVILPQYKLNLGRWAAHIKATGEFIGWCGLKYRPGLNEIDLGYRFMQQYWGKGYATEAAKHTLEYGFELPNVTVITGRAHVENVASLKVLEKIGMEYVKDEVVDDCPVKTYIAVK